MLRVPLIVVGDLTVGTKSFGRLKLRQHRAVLGDLREIKQVETVSVLLGGNECRPGRRVRRAENRLGGRRLERFH